MLKTTSCTGVPSLGPLSFHWFWKPVQNSLLGGSLPAGLPAGSLSLSAQRYRLSLLC